MDPTSLTVLQTHDGLLQKQFSAVELTQAYLDRIRLHSATLNAYLTVTEDEALAQAERVDQKLKAGQPLGLLEGIPVAIKDLFNTKGVRTTCASPGLKSFVPPYDATSVHRLREAGMVLLGKTNLDEFACGASTENSCFGVTKNPWDLSCVAGGSSGGSAAAVSADLCAYAIGTDTGGSIRQPASLCSVVGLKVTYGRVSRFGVTALASSLDTVGPFAKTVEDAAAILQVLAGHDPQDLTTPEVPVPDYRSLLKKDVKGLRIGIPKEYFGEGIEEETKKIVGDALHLLEKKGAVLKEISLPMTKYAVAIYYIIMPAELSANLARFDGIRFGAAPQDPGENVIDYYYHQRGEGFGDEIKRRIMIGTYVLSAGYFDAYYRTAQKVRTLTILDFNRAFEEVDLIAGPVSPTPAFKIGEKANDPLAMYLADAVTIPANAAGLPALSLPCGFSKGGLPIGLQLIGSAFEEGRVLSAGYAYQQMTDWHTRKPQAFLK